MAISRNDVQPVLDAVTERAAQSVPGALCARLPRRRRTSANGGGLFPRLEVPIPVLPVRLRRTTISGRAVIDGEIVHHADVVPLLDKEFPDTRENAHLIGCPGGARGAADARGWRVWRDLPVAARAGVVRARSSRAVADFRPAGGDRNRERTPIHGGGRPKSGSRRGTGAADGDERHPARHQPSQTDVQPVFDTIAQRAGKLCAAEVAVVSRFDGTAVQLAAIHGMVPEGVKIVRGLYPMKLDAADRVRARHPERRGGSL